MKPHVLLRTYLRAPHTEGRHIVYHNFWQGETAEEIWFTGFLRSRGLLSRFPRQHFVFFSALGNKRMLSVDELLHPFGQHRTRIFFSGENLRAPSFAPYADHLLSHPSISLSLGFEPKIADRRYMRFPLWILEMFPPTASAADIRRICDTLSHPSLRPDRKRFCALVSGDRGPTDAGALLRREMIREVENIASVDCAGRLLHNTDELHTLFADDKLRFLHQYQFYICPENTQAEGYVSEKPFHAIAAGCIPIYTGSFNRPEPEVLNPDAILFYQTKEDNSALLRTLGELHNSPSLYAEFYHQPRLRPDAHLYVEQCFSDLEERLRQICS